MTKQQLFEQITQKNSYLCVGLDTDIKKIPSHLLKEKDPIFEFNRQIIDATAQFAVAYKPNIAFYEALGAKGWESLQKTIEYIPEECFTIADAKRGDIGNTSSLYARTFFDKSSSGLDFDSVTVAPYMGSDSVIPFLEFEGKWVILLALTSNDGGDDFQQLLVNSEESEIKNLYQQVILTSQKWADSERMMYVVGATKADKLLKIREIAPEHFLLVPGIGAQGGSLEEVSKYGMNKQCGLLVNSSRAIIYASSGDDFAKVAAQEAQLVQEEMAKYLQMYL
ncbi:orotidine 5'-phosphate decarboxylase [Emticicia oligotrophica DSM 17448]|uniref:Orotidine-5'-phosphate decarboxylase n=1 Tax=Emticicia oligotrophica (strain DSM 17448 / CIP 109782 / MTCC 6937 / GPTSA100-15) TaxID=929562 RepID=A0ABM5N519_EMTOG|nr:orotidine-5'-phosphate decarboxylase [Emticicia oligotrophica]AFK04608.1 orotidine 5'-phosphate decarboxylase [Emticicia oligotrophica DSM 17448]